MRRPLRFCALFSLALLLAPACGDSAEADEISETGNEGIVGDGDTGDADTGDADTGDGDAGDGDGDATTGDGDGDDATTSGDGDGDPMPGECVATSCEGKVYQCGDCVDNDEDGTIDSADANCWGPCDNNEIGFKGNIPGQGHAPCTAVDCYFDADSGAGNDGCYWSHTCDPSEPNPSVCSYDPDVGIPGTELTCQTAKDMQSDVCENICGPLTPNGCDCFGCCDVQLDGETYTVYLGTGDGEGTCSLENVADPEKCAPCLQVPACLNPCEAGECEICIGQTVVPDDCDSAGCPDGITSCDPVNNSADCPDGGTCVTGCCYAPPL